MTIPVVAEKIPPNGNELGLSEMQRITAAFMAPTRSFSNINTRKASWWMPLLVVSILTLVFVIMVDKGIGFTAVTHNLMEAKPKELAHIESLPPADQRRAWALSEKIVKITADASPIIVIVVALVVSLILWLILLMTASRSSFGKVLSAFGYSSLPPAVVKSFLLIGVVLWGVGAGNFRLDSPLGSHLGYYLSSAGTSSFLYSIASSLDLFTIWTVILVGVGISCVSKFKRATAISIVCGCWLAWVLVQGALS